MTILCALPMHTNNDNNNNNNNNYNNNNNNNNNIIVRIVIIVMILKKSRELPTKLLPRSVCVLSLINVRPSYDRDVTL